MLRVAHVTEAFEGGVLTYLTAVLPRLVSLGCEVTLICSLGRKWPSGDSAVALLTRRGVKVKVVPMTKKPDLRLNALALLRMARILFGERFDLVHTHASVGGCIGRVAARAAGVRTVFHTPHCYYFLRSKASQRPLWLGLERILGRLTTLTVAVSRDEAQAAVDARIVPADRCRVVENCLEDDESAREPLVGSDLSDAKRRFGISPEAEVVTTVGRLVPYKGVFDFLEAARLCRRKNVVFVIAGDGPLRPAVEKWAEERLPNGRCRVLGHVSAIADLLSISDVVVSCSQAEGSPYALLEAMRAGRAIVAGDVPGNSSVIADDTLGRLVPPTPDAISRAIEEVLGNPGQRREYGRSARAHFVRNHLAENASQRLVRIYREWVRPSAVSPSNRGSDEGFSQ